MVVALAEVRVPEDIREELIWPQNHKWRCEELPELRAALGRPGIPWSQEDLAEAVEKSIQTIAAWERGLRGGKEGRGELVPDQEGIRYIYTALLDRNLDWTQIPAMTTDGKSLIARWGKAPRGQIRFQIGDMFLPKSHARSLFLPNRHRGAVIDLVLPPKHLTPVFDVRTLYEPV